MAQDYSWQWATRGGGMKRAAGESTSGYEFSSEQVQDIVVDSDNNYYYLAYITQQETEYDGLPINVYNATNSGFSNTDLLLVSTDCEGTLRWTQVIGGSGSDYSYKIDLDGNGGLYLTSWVVNISGPSNSYIPPHFSPDVALPVLDGSGQPQEGYKTAAVLKYNTADGSLAWYKMLQGMVNSGNRYWVMGNIIVDNDGNLRLLAGFRHGTHLDGQVTVPDTFTENYKFFIIKMNPEGEYIGITDIPMEGMVHHSKLYFDYDSNLDRYYIGGFRTEYGNNSILLPLSYGGTAFDRNMFLLALNGDGTEIWRRQETLSQVNNATELHAMEIDDDSNLYLAGKFFYQQGMTITFSGYTFPPVKGNVVWVMKMAPDGTVLWGTTPNEETSSNFPYDIAINGDEIALATEMFKGTWGDVAIDRGQNYLTDPVIVRFNKNTGVAFALHDALGPAGAKDSFTAIATDNDGNYIAGGYFRKQLFMSATDGVETLTKVNDVPNYTDFFIAKLAAGPCGVPAGTIDSALSSLNIYPVPTRDRLFINADVAVASYSVANYLGQVLLEGKLQPGQDSISLGSLQSGTYIINFTDASGRITSKKVVKE